MKQHRLMGWGTLAIVNAAIANFDRRSPLRYFLASLLPGPIVTVVLAATSESAAGKLTQFDVWRGRGAA